MRYSRLRARMGIVLLVLGTFTARAALAQSACNYLIPAPTAGQVDSAVQAAMDEVAHPWEMSEVLVRTGEILGCTTTNIGILSDGFETGTWSAWSTTTESLNGAVDCQTTYCSPYDSDPATPAVWYCGRLDSASNPGWQAVYATDDINRICYEHDNCYRQQCIQGTCAFAGGGSAGADCDGPMNSFCLLALIDPSLLTVDRIVCNIVILAQLLPDVVRGTECDPPPCAPPGGNVRVCTGEDWNGDGDTDCSCVWEHECNDGFPCSGFEDCVAVGGVGHCTAGVPVDCSVLDSPCTGTHHCTGLGQCETDNNGLQCADQNPCNGTETCVDPLGCVPGVPVICPPGYACNPANGGCQFVGVNSLTKSPSLLAPSIPHPGLIESCTPGL